MEIKELLPEVKENIILAKKTTFKIGGPARYFFISKSKKDLIKAVKAAKKLNQPFFILGGGSNVLFPDKGYNGLMINYQFPPGFIEVEKDKIITEGGVKLEEVVNISLEKSLSGIEWAKGIPGTIGGAVFGNSGAFGYSMGDVVEKIQIFDARNSRIKWIYKKDCQFSNKNSIFKKKNNLIILSVVLKLKKRRKKEIRGRIKEFLTHRKKNSPSGHFSAGCAFQNYQGKVKSKRLLESFPELKIFNKKKLIPASYLIDRCGLKGKKLGAAKISQKHANFILNLGGAKAKDVLKLMKIVKEKVRSKFGITLKEEIIVIRG